MFGIFLGLRRYATRVPLKKIKISIASANNSPAIEERQPTKLKKELDALQSQHPNHILLVQVGMFYEIYDCGNYLDEVSNLLNLRIAHHKSSDSINDHRYMRFAGFPMVSLKSYLPTLLTSGKSVAIVNQTVKDSLSNTDVSTGEFYFAQSTTRELRNELVRIQPKEILLSERIAERHDIMAELDDCSALVTKRPEELFTSQKSSVLLSSAIVAADPVHGLMAKSHLDVLKGLTPTIVEAAGGLMSYIGENFPDVKPVVQPPIEIDPKNILKLDPISIKSLEILRNLRDNTRKGSLLSVVDNTKTSAGSRLLASRLIAPGTVIDTINQRLDIVSIFYDNISLTYSILTLLSECADVEKALQRIHFRNGSPQDLHNIISTLKTAAEIKTILKAENHSLLEPLSKKLGDFDNMIGDMRDTLNSENLKNKVDMGVINMGVDKELDELRERSKTLRDKKESLAGVKVVLGNDIKYGPILSFGNVVESTRSRIEGVVKKNTKMNMISSGKLTLKTHYQIKRKSLAIIRMSGGLAELDVLCSNAKFALDNGYVKPEITTGSDMNIEGGRHPVVESYQLARGNTFVINDLSLTSKEKVNIITGPNMVTKFNARVIEMEETAYILNNASRSSLIIMDEVGRGTSTKDGLSLALSILEYIASDIKAYCLFATHYHELAPLITEKELKGIAFYQAAAVESKNTLTCLYKIRPGVMDQSHGIMMAKMAGIPGTIISKAKSYYNSYIVK
ncbi:hypothetical protein HK103_000094 [Boothiomyces macroporosus]|uniref:DNA mismatch repair proteins mutS family domain-containing protein n=1 Tax=Boothiomyces macroporosus TaxID=261099 RepID=A0AAD5UMZ2_9FUNG|nr:hypothetical protein HK103_000094 [Boothiomyces macroporosus]